MPLSDSDLAGCAAEFLSADELDRAARFRFRYLRDAFVLARAGLRTLLAGYLDQAPGAIRFAYDRFGKPSLAWPINDLRFNLSHSGNMAVYAFGQCRALGVDVEEVREMEDALDIARRFFASAEVAELENAGIAERHRLFFTCWVRKEAFIKAVGEALSMPLDSFRVQFLPGREPCVMDPDGGIKADWRLHDLPLGAGYQAALACYGGPAALHIVDSEAAGDVLRSAVGSLTGSNRARSRATEGPTETGCAAPSSPAASGTPTGPTPRPPGPAR